ncbi:MAG TPA: cytidine deaminase [Rhodospirillaceae bacterium]|nr:cytidine deaminase [Rhodospirillaceae bacterium]
MNDADLIARAQAVVNPRKLSPMAEAGGVGAALVTPAGNVYVGVCIETQSAIMCAERAAIAAMVTAGESRITTIVAVDWDGEILPPCGVCREFIWQVHEANRAARVLLPGGASATLAELLPHHWWRHGGG